MIDIEQHILFTFFDLEAARVLIDQADIRTYQNGDIVFFENDKADDVYLVLDGFVKITKKDPSGKEQVLSTIKENDYFGEYAVMDGLARSASAIVDSEHATLAKIPGMQILKAFKGAGGRTELQLALHIIRKVRENNQHKVEELLRGERNALLGQMAGAITHDLKNPTANIVMAISALSKKGLNEYQQQFCTMIRNDVDRMTAMEDEILDFARGAPSIQKTPIDIAEVFQKIKELNWFSLEGDGLDFEVLPCSAVMMIDKNKIFRVLQNLISNAQGALVKTKGKITVKAEQKEKSVEITVSDNGPGIPEEMRACLFEPFATMGKARGTGLGMAVSKSIIEAHEGTITFNTSPEKGTTFLIVLPIHSS